MSLVTKNCRLTEAHAFGLRQLKVICDSYTCNGCKREVSGCVLHCRVCPPAGFDVVRYSFLHILEVIYKIAHTVDVVS